ncbi:hypothetical protein HMPREF9098_0444 [Kingella denitrificans ATCC 33394]|uniref:Uncharacterized protein n=1 Tax=Kingella denitrificans ATCC 33394 TaxID=888741 RepID=F0EX64_9NEIS|nr:hypothetical protein HMPREF9098_0444 [Kingella denitrificans ATCC 33394]
MVFPLCRLLFLYLFIQAKKALPVHGTKAACTLKIRVQAAFSP